ncbi:hypothetical protein EON80_19895 [bacterium]|nr:MAG: hypothetical protein EON80_19895 [bacterium]
MSDQVSVNGTTLNAVPWHFLIQPYIKSTQLFACPSNTYAGGTAGIVANSGGIPISYLANGQGSNRPEWGGTRPMNRPVQGGGANQATMNYPSTTILVMESGWKRTEPDAWSSVDFSALPTAGNNNIRFINHLGLSNFLFVDGHVKAMKPTATGNPINLWNAENTGTTGDAQPGPAAAVLSSMLSTQQAAMQ